ncbi:MFS transporter [Bacillus wiedmannii]|uniref:MFS transporter n=1 Tax=Bacillus wiedmannii TaxID=1890302 RepID=UPI00094B0B44|nr:MFS transporter [Bacillus wiedmannii]MBZ4223617.1 MFS transporter [Bacillus wiedmannii]MED2933175.1 MFS transporter [Bacillus wiedmannii]
MEVNVQSATNKAINYKQNFLWFTLGRTITVMGTSVFDFVLSLYVLDLTGSVAAFSMILSLSIFPQAMVNIFGSVFVDKYNKKRIMIFAEITSALISILFMFLFIEGFKSVVAIAILVILLNALQSFFWLAGNASIPNIVGKDNVAKANSTLEGIWAIVNILGPVIGAIVYKKVGMDLIFLTTSIAFIIGTLTVTLISFERKKENKELNEGTYWESLKVVYTYLNRQKILKLLLIVAVLINFIYNPLLYLALPYITYEIVNVSAEQLSYIRAAAAIGTILGALYVFRLKSGDVMFKRFFILLQMQAVLIMLWAFPSLPIFNDASPLFITIIFVIVLITISTLNTVQNIPIIGYFQSKIPEEIRARVFGVLKSALLLSTPIGIWFYGLALQYIPWTYVVVASGLIIFTLCLILAKNQIFTNFVKNMDKE